MLGGYLNLIESCCNNRNNSVCCDERNSRIVYMCVHCEGARMRACKVIYV
jgi:hypothetical protein